MPPSPGVLSGWLAHSFIIFQIKVRAHSIPELRLTSVPSERSGVTGTRTASTCHLAPVAQQGGRNALETPGGGVMQVGGGSDAVEEPRENGPTSRPPTPPGLVHSPTPCIIPMARSRSVVGQMD